MPGVRRNRDVRVMGGRRSATAKAVPDGKVRCPMCRGAAKPYPDGKGLYPHNDLFKNACWNRGKEAKQS